MKNITLKSVFAIVACLSVLSFAALPEIRVTTKNNVAITSSKVTSRPGAGNCLSDNTWNHKYVAMTLTLTDPNRPANNITVTSHADSIRGRGNSTWAVGAKEPYRIKFGEKQSMFGLQKNKSWALLANYYDPTFALNAVAFELGKRVELPGTPKHVLVDLYINDSYKGIYQLTDLVQVNKGRVDIDEKDGWLVEFDYHCPSDADEIDFNTDYPNSPSNAKLHTFIKSPEVESNFNISNPAVSFVKNELNQLTTAMFNKSGFPENGYRDLVDLESVAKYLMIEMFIDNFDFNLKASSTVGPAPTSNFFHKDKGKKITAGPLWDFDLAAAVEMTDNYPKHYRKVNNSIKPKHPFHARFYDDPVFLAKLKKNWDKHKKDFQDMAKQGGFIDSMAAVAEGSVERNFQTQTSFVGGGGWGEKTNSNSRTWCTSSCPEAPRTVQAYKTEVGKLKTWWNSRIDNFEQQITAMRIDTTKDIPEKAPDSGKTSVAAWSKLPNGGSVAAAQNGINLSAANGASIKVFGLDGRVIRAQQFTRGNHFVRLGDLPKGMYMVRVAVDGHNQVLRVPVK